MKPKPEVKVAAPSTIQSALCQFTFNCEEKEKKQIEKSAEVEVVPAKVVITPSVQTLVGQEEVIVTQTNPKPDE